MTALNVARQYPGLHPEAAGWLQSFVDLGSTADGWRLTNSFVQMGVDTIGDCGSTCMLVARPMKKYEVLDWVHQHHGIYNQIVWDVIRRMGFTEVLRQTIEEDLTGPDQMIDGEANGKIVLKKYGWKVLVFLGDKPGKEWFGYQ